MAKKKLKKQTKSSTAQPSRSKEQVTKRNPAKWLPLVCACFAFLLYANTINHSYTLDDFSVIKDNFLTQQGIEGIPKLLTTNYRFGYWNSSGTLYRPISMVLFALEWELAPDQPWLSHLINVLLYALTGAFLFLTLSRFWPNRNHLLPLLVTLIYLAHPIHVEVVANIKSRDEILGFLFCILSLFWLLNYWDQKKTKYLFMALAAYTVAMFSKENAVTFLAVFPLCVYFFRKVNIVENLKISALFLVPVLLYLGIRYSILETATIANISALDNLLVASEGTVNQLAMAFVLIGKYLYTLLFPHPLVSEYGYPQLTTTTWSNWQALLSLAIYLGMGIFALFRLREKSILSFAILFFLITFSIYSNILIMIGSSYGERFAYVASLGFCLLLVGVLIEAFGAKSTDGKASMAIDFQQNKSLLVISGIILLLYTGKTITRNADWYNSYSLYAADISKVPNSAKLNYHLGLEEVKKGLDVKNNQKLSREWQDKGLVHFQKALELYPTYGDAHAQIGLSLFRRGYMNEALESYEKALKYNPLNAKVYSNMGIIYFQQKNLKKAEEVYLKAVQLDPRYVDAHRNLGSVYAQTKRFDQAIQHFRTALDFEPNSAILHFYLGSAYRDKGEPKTAKPFLDKAYQLNPALKR